MIFEIDKEAIIKLVFRQIDNNFILLQSEREEIEGSFDAALKDCEENFIYSDNKYFSRVVSDKKQAYFNPYHSVQWMIFLYYLAHRIYLKGVKTTICDKLYYLNKMLNGLDIFYAINLPNHFGAEHPVGSVLGRAKYGENFFFYQGCTVGGTHNKNGGVDYPIIGDNVRLFANSSILGRCVVGNNVKVGAGALIKNQDVPDNSVVFGESPNLIIKQNR